MLVNFVLCNLFPDIFDEACKYSTIPVLMQTSFLIRTKELIDSAPTEMNACSVINIETGMGLKL